MTQTILPFKLEATSELLTVHSGLSVLLEFIHGIGFSRWIGRIFPCPGNHRGYLASQYLLPLLLMLHGGGRSLEDIRMIKQDNALMALFGWGRIPSSDAIGDWLRRQGGTEGEKHLKQLHSQLFRQGLKASGRHIHTLDIDASVIEAWKQQAAWTYKGFKGYGPIVAHVDGWIAGWLFRAGNASPAAGHMALIQSVKDSLPEGHRIGYFRADSASYQAEMLNHCEQSQISFAIGAGMDPAVKACIAAIKASDWQPYKDGQIAETVHSMAETKQAFRLIVFRAPKQRDLWEGDDVNYRYHVIASNFPRTGSMKAVHHWYCQRGDASENRIKELKIGFGMERMPCGQEKANGIFFAIGCLAYNIFVRFRQCLLSDKQQRCQIQTIRWQLYQVAGKVTRHARQVILKVNGQACQWMSALRQRCIELRFGYG